MNHSHSSPDLSSPRSDPEQVRNKQSDHRERYWRSIEELARRPEFAGALEREFAPGAAEWPAEVDRRTFLSLMAASLALAGITGCTKQPLEEIVPYVRQPEEITLGKPLYFATAMPLGGFGTGILVKSREGRPIKADGNPLHPASLGGSNVWIQACLLDLYDPDRAKAVTRFGQPSSWSMFLNAMNRALQGQRKKAGAGLRILTGSITSPTLGTQLKALLKEFPEARWHQYEPINRDNVLAGSEMAFSEYVATHYNFQRAKIIFSLDSDFLYGHPDSLRYARHFTDGRRIVENGTRMNRLYVLEPTPSITGAMADHRLPMTSREIEVIAQELAKEVGIPVSVSGTASQEHRRWISVIADELRAHRGECVVAVGQYQSPATQALGHMLNEALGNVGQTVHYTAPAEVAPVRQTESLRELVQEMARGRVELLVIVGGNPAFDAPSDLEFGKSLGGVGESVHLCVEVNETSSLCAWNIPRTHFLETWSDIRSFDGTATIMQPLIAPLFDGRSEHELIDAMLHLQPQRSSYQIVREFWRGQNLWTDFENGWRRAVHDGVVEGTAANSKNVKARPSAPPPNGSSTKTDGIEISFRPDPNLWDGRFANNPWLHEVPKPISKLTWDNAVLISPMSAEREKLSNGDMVQVNAGGRAVSGAVLITPGQPDNCVTLHLGYGRTQVGRAGDNVGFNFYPLRSSDALWSFSGHSLKKTGERHELVRTQTHHRLEHEDRQIYRAGTFEQWRANREFIQEQVKSPAREQTLYNAGEFEGGRKWGMSIDLGACIGCNACLMACNIENNIPVVGKKQVAMNREMLWLRIDTYFKGPVDNPETCFQPVPCMHCENAPCEYVCPVEAAIHDHEGLNLQVYNRCVGTRYCSNNCPYKVRRFNFLHYANPGPLEALGQNPEVTVRSRGVMEKCTYCVQRIAAARIDTEKENRPIRDGEVRTACQEACPANAIIFGVMTDAESTVAKYKKHPLDFSMLGQLNVRPRTTYLAKITNPNPQLRTEAPRQEKSEL